MPPATQSDKNGDIVLKTTGGKVRTRTLGLGLLLLMASVVAVPAPPVEAHPEDMRTQLVVVPDIDGDGLDDLLYLSFHERLGFCDQTLPTRTLLVEARRGTDAALLWQLEHDLRLCGRAHPELHARRTASGRGGAFLFAGDHIIAVDEHGQLDWTMPAQVEEFKFLDAVAGPATDLLVRFQLAGETRRVMVDGASGLAVSVTSGPLRDSDPATQLRFIPVGDFNGDGLDDYLLRQQTATRLSYQAFRGTDGVRLWVASSVKSPNHFGGGTTVLGDLTGDGVDDFSYWSGLVNALQVRSGKTGALVWSYPGTFLAEGVLGDVNSDGVADLFAYEYDRRTYQVVNGRTGLLLYRYTALEAATFSYDKFSFSVGDIDADGANDVHVKSADPAQDMFLSGRDASTLRTGPLLYPIGASLDGNGADLLKFSGDSVSSVVAAFDGRTAAPLWERTLPVKGLNAASTASFDGDGVPDLLVTDVSVFPPPWIAVSGADGRVLWRL